MNDAILEQSSEKLVSGTAVSKDIILDHLFGNGIDRPIPMNEFLKQFNVGKLENFVFIFRDLEKNELIRCVGNFWWLGSWYSGEFVDLSHPLAQFTCQLLPAGVQYVQEKNSKQLAEERLLNERLMKEQYAKERVIKRNIVKEPAKEIAKEPAVVENIIVEDEIAIENPDLMDEVEPGIPWYEHWAFWLIGVTALMGTLIGLVECNS